MRQTKTAPGTAKKSAAKRTTKAVTKKKATPGTAVPPRGRGRKKAPSPKASGQEATVEPSISEAQSKVVASKFLGPLTRKARPRPRPTLPLSYGESHLLLLVRDPQTLFAAWDIAAPSLLALKARIGSRAFAVSSFTLRLIRAGGDTSVVHLGKKARSRYFKVDGGPSFLAEIGFTSPAGRFELLARSAPCFVPMGPVPRSEAPETARRAVLGYREARALARRGLGGSPPGGSLPRARSTGARDGVVSPGGVSPARVLGGSSDLYRR
jgi:hypothetical protein